MFLHLLLPPRGALLPSWATAVCRLWLNGPPGRSRLAGSLLAQRLQLPCIRARSQPGSAAAGPPFPKSAMQPQLALLLWGLLSCWADFSPATDRSLQQLPKGAGDDLFSEFASHSAPDFCWLPSALGPCRDSILRFYYSPHVGRCEKFVYGGCEGNRNNFEMQLQCLQTCADPGICRLPSDAGFGDAYRFRYFYDSTSRTCDKFLYKGHRGNGNNFLEEADCLRFCAARGVPGQ
ncbi:BPTI/Kunitz domain-containing protein-like [Rhineura floridana]|uniref:BPTI/Kunitz domain-containing protein-like n=1 Tax=Rhineura floridana TaxID=261503 RepID=UPI002AC86694|nr:BPTI/Kunitz domain-containing protein-like [Rhineura floridana]